MKRRMNSAMPVILLMTLILIACTAVNMKLNKNNGKGAGAAETAETSETDGPTGRSEADGLTGTSETDGLTGTSETGQPKGASEADESKGISGMVESGQKAEEDQADHETDRWQLAAAEMIPDTPAGFGGLVFSQEEVIRTDGGFFRLVKDDDSGIRYAYVPAEMRGPLHVFMSSAQSLRIEGDGVSGTFRSGDVLPEFAEDVKYDFTLLNASGTREEETAEVVFLYSENVPSMYIDTKSGSMEAVDADGGHATSEDASYRIYGTDGGKDSSGKCSIRGRGNSTWAQPKKPYNLNLEDENEILGMNSCSKYALVANYWDSTQTRQYYAFAAAERLGLAYTPQTRFVNVYLNGRCHGICLLTQRINVKGGTVDITDLDAANKNANKGTDTPPTLVMDTDEDGNKALAGAFQNEPKDITGGYLIEFDNRYDTEDYWFATGTRHMVFKSPQIPSAGEYEYISDYVREAEKALFAGAVTNEKGETDDDVIDEKDGVNPETGKTVWDYFDLDSWARMYLIQDFFVQSDDEFYSFYFYKEAGDPLLYCGPVWDFDLCLGNMNSGDYYRTSARTLWLRDGRKRWLHRMDQFPEFRERVAQIYLEELEPILRDILENEYGQNEDLLEKDTNLNYLRWHKKLDYRERTGMVRTLFEERVQFMHDYYFDPESFCRLLFHFAWGDFSYYVKKGESMGFVPTAEYGETQSSVQREGNGLITGWQDTESGGLLQADTVISQDREYDPVYE